MLSSGGEGVPTFSHDLHQEGSKITTSQVQTKDSMRESITFIDGDSVGNTISRIKYDTSGTTRSVQGEYSLNSNIHCGHAEGFKHHLGHLFTVSLGVKGSFSEKGGRFFWGNAEFIVESVVPDLFHIIPVGDDTVFNWVFEGEDTSLALGFITNVGVLLTHTNHDTLVTGSTYDGGEDSSGSVISGETGLYETRAIVTDKSSIFVVTHFDKLSQDGSFGNTIR